MVKMTTEQLSGLRGLRSQIRERLDGLQDQSYALSGIIIAASKLFGSFEAPIKDGGTDVGDLVYAWVLKQLSGELKSKLKLKKIIVNKISDSIPVGRTKDEIKINIGSLFDVLEIGLNQKFDDCIEVVNGEAVVTGIKVSKVQLRTWSMTLTEARSDLQLIAEFNEADFKNTLKSIILSPVALIRDNLEQYIFNGFKQFSDGEKAKVKVITEQIDRLYDLVNTEYPECGDSQPPKPKEETPIPTQDTADPTYIEFIPIPQPDPTAPEDDCCKELVKSINKLDNLKSWFNLVIRWIRDTRIELKEARQDLKKLLQWIADTRTELKEARQDAKKILANQDLILDALYDLQLDVATNHDQIINNQKMIVFNGNMMSIGFSGIASLISGLSNAIAAIFAGIMAELDNTKNDIIGNFDKILKAIAALDASLNAAILRLNTEILKLGVQIAKDFIRLEDLINKLTDEIDKIPKLLDWISKLIAIGFTGLAALIGAIGIAIGAALAAIIAEIAELEVAILTEVAAGFAALSAEIAGVEASLAAGFLRTQAEITRLMVQMAKGFLQLEELINPYINGKVTSYDWVEMTAEEKAAEALKDKEAKEKEAKDKAPAPTTKETLISEDLVDPTSAIVTAVPAAITVTKSVALTALKLNPKAIVYAGYGLLGVIDLLQKTVSIINDLQGDVKEPSTLATIKVKIPTIAWYPEIYQFDKNGNRDYSKLALAKDPKGKEITGYYQPPDYSNATPYIKIEEIDIPVGMEESYLYDANKEIDEFWQNYLNPPVILMPDGWEQRPMKYRPQLEFMFVEVKEDGTYNRQLNYCLNVQHYNIALGKPTKCPIADYRKGTMGGIMLLDDGAKNVVYGETKKGVLKVMQDIYAITDPNYCRSVILTSEEENNIKWFERNISTTGEPMKTVNVSAVWCDYFSTGRLNRTYKIQRDWRVYFDRATLF